MSGHSKWANIKHRKSKSDAQKGQVFTKLGREIQLAVRSGGPDPDVNSRLKDLIAKARGSNMPGDSIQRSIRKAAGSEDNEQIEEITYEGYGPAGIALMIRAMTDNRNRTAGDVRHMLDKYGGNLGTTGCVSFLFHEKGVILASREDSPGDGDESAAMMDALEAGAEDFDASEDLFEIYTPPQDFYVVREALEKKGYAIADSSIRMVPITWVRVEDPEVREKMEKMLEVLEEHDDIQEVFHNWET